VLDGMGIVTINGLNDDFVATISKFTSFNVPCPSCNVSIALVSRDQEKMINKSNANVASMY
jgi:hypothetical protein